MKSVDDSTGSRIFVIMRQLAVIFLFAGILVACTMSKKSVTPDLSDEKATLLKWMSGSFSSSVQAEKNQAYYDISLHMYPIWIEDENADWLYVEQAMSSMQHKPYRQRVYKIVQSGANLVSEVYEIPDPDSFIGKWRGGTEWDNMSPADLIPREGCTVTLEFLGSHFQGATAPATCKSSLNGASHATSEVRISSIGIDSWDRGYDESGKQVWGAVQGPYEFRRMSDIPD